MNDHSTLSQQMRERTESLTFSPVDLDAIVSAGDRRRRRRVGAIVGGVAALAVVGAVSVVVTEASGPTDVGAAAQEPAPAPPAERSWAHGETLETPTGRILFERPIHAYVATDRGYVVVDVDGAVWSVLDGRAEEVGSSVLDPGTRALVTDGEWTAWTDRSGDALVYRVLDQDTAAVESLAGVVDARFDLRESSFMASLDDGVLYTVDGRGIAATDVRRGTADIVMEDVSESFDLVDARAGLFAVYDEGLRIGSSPTQTRELPGVFGSNGLISPDARFYAPDEDTLTVRTVTGDDVTPQLPTGFGAFSTTVSWWDADTIGVLASTDGASFSLLSCEVPSGGCTVDVEDLGGEGEFQLPVGQHLGG
ncbi:hypothetical protein [Nocardioides sp. R-C-SC26]|uniref:hypothetical protein n=1 Tax=Nocardioides sp. R-C-SC26 TaxID=2870414 RepID=UPI001E43365B|nr:hypothetical protein [Nocardioides sp. R-C-SC26]